MPFFPKPSEFNLTITWNNQKSEISPTKRKILQITVVLRQLCCKYCLLFLTKTSLKAYKKLGILLFFCAFYPDYTAALFISMLRNKHYPWNLKKCLKSTRLVIQFSRSSMLLMHCWSKTLKNLFIFPSSNNGWSHWCGWLIENVCFMWEHQPVQHIQKAEMYYFKVKLLYLLDYYF